MSICMYKHADSRPGNHNDKTDINIHIFIARRSEGFFSGP